MNVDQIAIQTDNLTRRFGPVLAVDRLDLAVPPRRDLRPGGAGRRRQDDHHPHAGRDSWIPAPAARRSPASTRSRSREPIKRRIGYMAQQFNLYGDLTRPGKPRLLCRHL